MCPAMERAHRFNSSSAMKDLVSVFDPAVTSVLLEYRDQGPECKADVAFRGTCCWIIRARA
jgi:hypothetical protein